MSGFFICENGFALRRTWRVEMLTTDGAARSTARTTGLRRPLRLRRPRREEGAVAASAEPVGPNHPYTVPPGNTGGRPEKEKAASSASVCSRMAKCRAALAD
jgi:hypothetical protein